MAWATEGGGASVVVVSRWKASEVSHDVPVKEPCKANSLMSNVPFRMCRTILEVWLKKHT